jgi:hypothetical protein
VYVCEREGESERASAMEGRGGGRGQRDREFPVRGEGSGPASGIWWRTGRGDDCRTACVCTTVISVKGRGHRQTEEAKEEKQGITIHSQFTPDSHLGSLMKNSGVIARGIR